MATADQTVQTQKSGTVMIELDEMMSNKLQMKIEIKMQMRAYKNLNKTRNVNLKKTTPSWMGLQTR